jgi:site-specific DNA-methyltransferase (adenine-specific)
MEYKVINGDNLEILKRYPDNYFDAIVTDPPYGLGKEPDATELMKDWVEKGYHEVKGSGFMGKEWDAFVPQPIFWKEVFRVLKHGGHVVAFYGTRTYDWGVMAMRFAGFEVRDCIQWLYGSGFPKSHNISKALDKIEGAEREIIAKSKNGAGASPQKINNHAKGDTGIGMLDGSGKEFDITAPSTEAAKQWDGWGTALKPANEPIVLARKPLEKGLSIAENVLKWGTGGINIDGSRIGFTDGGWGKRHNQEYPEWKGGRSFTHGEQHLEQNDLGRFPANIILTHHPECECKGVKKIGSGKEGGYNYKGNVYDVDGFVPNNSPEANSNYGQETIEDWTCHEDCPIRIMDEQSGVSKSVIRKPNGKPILNVEKGWNNNSMIDESIRGINDKGGASRFFYVAKASKSERNKGLEGFEEKESKKFDGGEFNSASTNANERTNKNFHPTVKPVKLMQYLVRLVTPPNGKVLDPFCGSGTTGIACKLEGFEFVGIEQDPEYSKIAEARIQNWVEEKEQKPKNKEKQDCEIEPMTQLNLF